MLNGYLDWPGVAQVCRIEAKVRRGAEETCEVSYAITSVPEEEAGSKADAIASSSEGWLSSTFQR